MGSLSRDLLLKIIELILHILIVFFHHSVGGCVLGIANGHLDLLLLGAMYGYFAYIVAGLIAQLIDGQDSKNFTDDFMYITGGLIFLICGTLLLLNWLDMNFGDRSKGITLSVFCIVQGVAYPCDWFSTSSYGKQVFG